MTTFEKLRLSHAALAVLAVAAYVTGEAGLIHAWLGYGVAAVLAFRILWGLVGPRQVGIARLLPDLTELSRIRLPDHPAISRTLIAGIVASLLTVTATGVALDGFRSLPMPASVVASAQALTVPTPTAINPEGNLVTVSSRREREHGEGHRGAHWIKEVHEAVANFMLALVGLHVVYLLLFKRKLAAYMLFQRAK